MRELIKVTITNENKQVVSARDLHEGLFITERFNSWFNRMLQYGFIENEDFTSVKTFTVVNNGAKKEIDDYVITLDMAKEISMIQRNEIGKMFRQYFIECEKQLKESAAPTLPTTYLDALKALVASEEQKQILSAENAKMKPKAVAYDKFMNTDGTYTTTNACKMLGLKRNKTFEFLRSKHLVYKEKTEATIKAINRGYFKHIDKGGYSTMVITPKGIEYLREQQELGLI